MNSESFEKINHVKYAPVDIINGGFSFSCLHKMIWFKLSLIFALIFIIVDGLFSTFAESLQFVASIFALFVHCWFISSVVAVSVEQMRGNVLNFAKLIKITFASFVTVPKVLFSLMSILLIFSFGLPFSLFSVPLWGLSVLCLWAPLFAAVDASIVETEKDKTREKRSDLGDGDFFEQLSEPDLDESKKVDYSFYFVVLPFWDFGLHRSVRFSVSRIPLAIYFLWFVVISFTLPLTLVSWFFDVDNDSFGAFLYSVLGLFALSLVVGCFTCVMVSLLPEQSKKMLGLSSLDVSSDTSDCVDCFSVSKSSWILKVRSNIFYIILLFILSVISFTGYANYVFKATSIPSTANVAVIKSEQAAETFKLTLRIMDSSTDYTWLEPQRFAMSKKTHYIAISADSGDDSQGENLSAYTKESDLYAKSSGGLFAFSESITPTQIELYDERDQLLPLGKLYELHDSVTVVLIYQGVNMSELESYSLFYQRIPGYGSMISQKIQSPSVNER